MSDETTSDSPTNLVDLMAELIPPPEPAPISLVPQTLGWPVLVLLLAGLTTIVLRRIIQARRAEAYRDAALAALDAAGTAPDTVARVLRQTALTAFPRAQVASLHGTDWLTFLEKTGGRADLHDAGGEALITLPYSDATALPDASLELVRHWIRHHDRTLQP
ncbi:MAG: DUF4381 domain-containing protein [Pseudomonadota bacterium]